MSAPDPATSWRGLFTADRLHHVAPANAHRVRARRAQLGLADCGAVCVPPAREQWPLPLCPRCYPAT